VAQLKAAIKANNGKFKSSDKKDDLIKIYEEVVKSPAKKPSAKKPTGVDIGPIVEKLKSEKSKDGFDILVVGLTNAVMIEIIEALGGKVTNRKTTKPKLVQMIKDLLRSEEAEEEEEEVEEKPVETEEEEELNVKDFETIDDLDKLKKIYNMVVVQINAMGRGMEKKDYNNKKQIRDAIRKVLAEIAKLEAKVPTPIPVKKPTPTPVKKPTPTPVKKPTPAKPAVGVVGVAGKPVVGKPTVLAALGVGREVGGKTLERTLLDMDLLNDNIMNEINRCLTGK